MWWKCKEGHEWVATPNHRNQGHGCPYCTHQRVIKGKTDLSTTNPEIAKEWAQEKNGNLRPEDVFANSHQKVWWKGKCGHEWEATVANRNKGRGCPYCSNPPKLVLRGFNDLATQFPNIAIEWHYERNRDLNPEDVLPYSNRLVWWKGKCGHEWQTQIYSRVSGNNCPYCSGQMVLRGFNDLETVNKDLTREWNYEKNGDLLPSMVTSGSNKKVWWKGKCGHEWKASIGHRNNGRECPYCSSKKLLTGFNDFKTWCIQNDKLQLVEEWNYEKNGGTKPEDIMPFTRKKIWWRGQCGHEWQSSVADRVNQLSGCPFCSGRRVLKGFNDLETVNPDLALEWNYEKNGNLMPDMFTVGSNKKVWWRCVKGHEWRAQIGRRSGSSGSTTGCPTCSESHLEKTVRSVLKKHDFEFKEQVTFKDLVGTGKKRNRRLSYDFGIYYNMHICCLIECQGEQHYYPVDFFGGKQQYMKQIKHDQLKKEYCQKRNIKLIEIPYFLDEYEIEKLIVEELMTIV